jgi:hypothetical protein
MIVGMMLRRFNAVRECARLWREEQSRAIDIGDVARAKQAEKCAQRFDDYLAEVRPRVARKVNVAASGSSR